MRTHLSVALWLTWPGTALATGQSKEARRLESAAIIVKEIIPSPEQDIPRNLPDIAVGVGVIPSKFRLAFGLGGCYGRDALAWGNRRMRTRMYGGVTGTAGDRLPMSINRQGLTINLMC